MKLTSLINKNNNGLELSLSIEEICKGLGVEVPSKLDPSEIISKFDVPVKGALIFSKNTTTGKYKKAVKNGIRVVVSTNHIDEIPCITVSNIMNARFIITKMLYDKVERKPTIVVAGSTGKTSTKIMAKDVLSQKYNTFCYEKNANTIRSLIYLLQHIDPKSDLFIQEVDESTRNNTKYCSLILKPEVAMITNMGESHIGVWGGQDKIIQSITEIESGLTDDGIVVINADDENSVNAKFLHRVVSVGIDNKDADYFATNICDTKRGIEFDLNSKDNVSHLKINVKGIHNVYNAMMAYVVGKNKGMDDLSIKKGLLKFQNSGFRQNIWETSNKLIYADCYNASAQSIKFALKTFCDIPVKENGRRVAVLGDVFEIEGYEELVYSKIAKSIDESQIDILVTIGEQSYRINEMTKNHCEKHHVNTINELNDLLRRIENQGGSNYLFKASRGVGLEESIATVFQKIYKSNIRKDKIKDLGWKIKSRL